MHRGCRQKEYAYCMQLGIQVQRVVKYSLNLWQCVMDTLSARGPANPSVMPVTKHFRFHRCNARFEDREPRNHEQDQRRQQSDCIQTEAQGQMHVVGGHQYRIVPVSSSSSLVEQDKQAG